MGVRPFPLRRLTPHSLSRRVRDLLAADLGAHREYPVDPDEDTAPAKPAVPVVGRGVYSEQDRKRAWERRRHDLRRVAEVHDSLAEVDRRIAELDRRAAVVLAGQERAPARSADGAPAEPR